MDGGRAAEAFGRALERRDAPVADFIEVDVERRLVELNGVDPGRLDCARLGVQDFGEREGELVAALVVIVIERIDHRHRTR